MAKFDPVLKQHVADMETQVNHTSPLKKNIQNKVTDCIGESP